MAKQFKDLTRRGQYIRVYKERFGEIERLNEFVPDNRSDVCQKCDKKAWRRYLCSSHFWQATYAKDLPTIEDIVEEIEVGTIRGFSDARRVNYTNQGLKRVLRKHGRLDLVDRLYQYDYLRGNL